MIRSKAANAVVAVAVAIMLVLTGVLSVLVSDGTIAEATSTGYAESLFSTDRVHTIDIQVSEDDWQQMLDNATSEEYIVADVVIDDTKVSGVGLRPKGNSSLSSIASSDSDRYSFKVEFDQFTDGRNYLGLDKLVLNNIAQDTTYMKDYITYQMMTAMGAYAPLCSFIWVTVNGEDWGLYLAVEAIEESFVERQEGTGNVDEVQVYKPDSMDMNEMGNGAAGAGGAAAGGFTMPDGGEMPEGMQIPEGGEGEFTPPEGRELPEGMQMPEDGTMPEGMELPEGADADAFAEGGMPGGMGGGMGAFGGSDATILAYTDDNEDSYSAIFDNAVFDTSKSDRARLISSIKQLNEGTAIEEVVNTEEVISYFAVHNFVLNSDSYTGSLTHNYYLYEKDGELSMVAWDYNLAFGGMGGMGGMGATTYANYPIDSPMLSGAVEDRPMIAWIFADETYLDEYHAELQELVDYFDGGAFAAMYDEALSLIAPYVEKDPTAFSTYEEFDTGAAALREFCLLRAESISKQLSGEIAATSEAQETSGYENFVDASSISIESMGTNNMGFNAARGGAGGVRGG